MAEKALFNPEQISRLLQVSWDARGEYSTVSETTRFMQETDIGPGMGREEINQMEEVFHLVSYLVAYLLRGRRDQEYSESMEHLPKIRNLVSPELRNPVWQALEADPLFLLILETDCEFDLLLEIRKRKLNIPELKLSPSLETLAWVVRNRLERLLELGTPESPTLLKRMERDRELQSFLERFECRHEPKRALRILSAVKQALETELVPNEGRMVPAEIRTDEVLLSVFT